MALENEARFRLPEAKYQKTVERLNATRHLSSFNIMQKGPKSHSDTYFDINGVLRRRGWSFRIRISGNEIRATLKTPIAKAGATYGKINEELENSDNSGLIDTLSRIMQRLADEGVVPKLPSDLDSRLLIKGIYPTLREIGLHDLFTV